MPQEAAYDRAEMRFKEGMSREVDVVMAELMDRLYVRPS
jgi:hypothetical protein